MFLDNIFRHRNNGAGTGSDKSRTVLPGKTNLTSSKYQKKNDEVKNDWASRSGFYYKLSDDRKKKLDNIIKILERDYWDN
jgi:hypothetical protein